MHAQAGVAVKVHFGIMYDHANACNVVFFNLYLDEACRKHAEMVTMKPLAEVFFPLIFLQAKKKKFIRA